MAYTIFCFNFTATPAYVRNNFDSLSLELQIIFALSKTGNSTIIKNTFLIERYSSKSKAVSVDSVVRRQENVRNAKSEACNGRKCHLLDKR